MWWMLGLAAVSIATAAAVVWAALPRLGQSSDAAVFIRYVAVSGIAAIGSTLMYLVYEAGGGIIALVAGDVIMVAAPALILLALLTVAGQVGPGIAVLLAACATTAVVTALVPLPGSLAVKALVLAALCAGCAARALASDIRRRAGARILLFVNVLYAAFSVARVLVGLTAGWGSELYRYGFSIYPTTVIGAVVVACTGIGALAMARTLGPETPPLRDAGELARADHPAEGAVWWELDVADLRLVRDAYGEEQADALLAATLEAGREIDPGTVRGGLPVRLSTATTTADELLDDVRRRIRASHPTLPPELLNQLALRTVPAPGRLRSAPPAAPPQRD